MKISKEKILKKGNESLAAGGLLGVGAVACPCPTCICSSLLFLINGIREKLG